MLAFSLVLVLASPAFAGLPIHPALPTSEDIVGLNHACGVAVDSRGDIYASSAGQAEVKIFDSGHHELTSIPDSNEPCGLAVDSEGNLYVSNQAPGKVEVVKYSPNAYPFSGAPTFSGPTTIDSSGLASGITVDPFDDRLYVAKGDRVDVYESTGSFIGSVGSGDLADARGVAAYTYATSEGSQHYISVADATSDEIKVFSGPAVPGVTLRQTIDGSDKDAFKADKTPDNGIGFGAAGVSLAADDVSGHFFAYDADHEVVDEFEATGSYLTQIGSNEFDDAEPTAVAVIPQRNEVQRLEINATKGTYTLTFRGQSTAPPIPYNATAGQIKAALEGLSTVGPGNVDVHGKFLFGETGTYVIAFMEDLGNEDVPDLIPDDSELTFRIGFLKGASVSTEAPGSGPGRLYVTTGPSAGAKLISFGPLTPPSRAPNADLSFNLKNTNSVAVDLYGNRYVGADASIYVYPPGGNTPVATISDAGKPYDLAVDSACNVYALDSNSSFQSETVSYFTPSACPPKAGTQYTKSPPIATSGPPFFPSKDALSSIGINAANDHLYVSQAFSPRTTELDSAKNGSGVLNSNWGAGLVGVVEDIDTYAANGNVYVSSSPGARIYVVNSAGTEILGRITGKGGPNGPLEPHSNIAVDQSNGHVIAFSSRTRGVAEEYEASGAFVAQFGSFSMEAGTTPYRLAIDNSCALHKPVLINASCEAFDPSAGNAYIAFDDPAPGSFDLTSLAPLSYGEPPIAVTGRASNVSAGLATLNGTVDPRGFELSECKFEYLTSTLYASNGKTFAGAVSKPCVESIGGIGADSGAVAVHADLTGLDPEGRYYFRLLVGNKFGEDEGAVGIFGPPLLITRGPQPFYDEATLRANVDPSGLPTQYHFEYGSGPGEYSKSTPISELAPDAGPTDVQVGLAGLTEGTTYHFRIVVENEAKSVLGADQHFDTQERLVSPSCSNADYRIGFSANLPECRAYELVTPADTRGMTPEAVGTIYHMFNNWLVSPRGTHAGERLSYFVGGTLPGFDGNGRQDGYVSQRATGAHPSQGWGSELFSPTYLEAAADLATPSDQEGLAADQEYSLWKLAPLEGSLSPGSYVRTPSGFEPLGKGSLGTDPEPFSDYISPGGTHIIFNSTAHLEEATPPVVSDTEAIYDRAAGSSSADVVSLKPGNVPLSGGEDATYVGSTEDGAAVVFKAGGVLYLRRADSTVEIAAAPNTFAGISTDGKYVFYAAANVTGQIPATASLFICAVESGSCAGSGKSHEPTEIAPNSRFVNVPADGTHVYFTSTEVLDTSLEGSVGADNLYIWEAANESIKFVATLDPGDLAASGFQGVADNLVRWTDAIGFTSGRALSPTRSSADGSILAFQSFANLTEYDAKKHSEIYLYNSKATPGEQLICISCNPDRTPPSGEAVLQDIGAGSTSQPTTLIPNLTEDGSAVFFQSDDPLLPEDANAAEDVYEWMAPGAGACKREGGCLALISSGQGEHDSFLYSMTPDGHDVFFSTLERLVSADVIGSPSLYDARVEGGIPDSFAADACQGDACQGSGGAPPSLASPVSTGPGGGNVESKPARRCAKGKRRIKQRCVSKHRKQKLHHGGNSGSRRAGK